MIEEFHDGKTVLVLNSEEMVCLRALCLDAVSRLNGKPLVPLPLELGERRRVQMFLRQLLEATDPWFEGEDWKLASVDRKDIELVGSKIGAALQRAKGPVAIGYKP